MDSVSVKIAIFCRQLSRQSLEIYGYHRQCLKHPAASETDDTAFLKLVRDNKKDVGRSPCVAG